MKFPLTSDELKQEIYLSIDQHQYALSQRYRQLKKVIIQADDTLILEGILQVFEDKTRGQRAYREQEFAGKLLSELKPNTAISLPNILSRTLNNYNTSVKELPYYLAEKFGVDTVAKALYTIEKENADKELRESVKVFKYWLKIE